jgi:glycosyltransferase involved in cell wall biosynthesis
MHVLHCIPSMDGGGAERQLAYLAGELIRQGCQVDVALTRGGVNLARLEASGARIHELGTVRTHDPRLLVRLTRMMAGVKPDVVQCWLTQMQIAGGAAALMLRLPWVFSERASAEAYPPTFKNLVRARIGRTASAIVSNSAGGDRYWAAGARGDVPRYVVPNGLPLEELAAVPAATEEAAGLAPGERLVLFAGRFDHQKNAGVLVRALGLVRTSVPFRAILFGDGPLRSDVEQLIRACGLQANVRVAGYTPQLWGLMKRADLFVSASAFEGNPNVVLEAMAVGCPLIVSRIFTHEEFLDERTAILVTPGDSEALARAIEAVLGDTAGARRRAVKAAERTVSRAMSSVARQYIRIYEDVLQRRAGARMRVTT